MSFYRIPSILFLEQFEPIIENPLAVKKIHLLFMLKRNEIQLESFALFFFFFIYQGLAASKGKQPPLCRGWPHKKDENQESIHTHIHSSQPLRHSLVLQERCNQTGSRQP